MRNFVATNDESMKLPAQFEDTMRQLLGDDYEAFRKALLGEAAVSIRLNRNKCAATPDYEPVLWATDGYYLKERPSFTFDPLLHAGCYYVQEASSMFVEQAVKQHLGAARVALDLCAAPGGKSTLLRSLLPDDCVLVSNEVMRPRAQVLAENITKWGHPRSIVTSNYPADFTPLGELFDLILVDAPCSGEGMFRKDAGAVEEWSPKNVQECVARQCEILDDVWDALKPGGVLIYSTCTFNQEENEQNVKWIIEELGAELLPIAYDPTWGIVEGNPGYHFYPHKTKGEGFYLCAFRKHGLAIGEVARPLEKRLPKFKPQLIPRVEHEEVIKQWLQHSERWLFRQQDRFVLAYPAKYKELIEILSKQFICVSTGFGVCELRGKMPVPQHALAMAKALRKEAFREVELPLETALAYLRNEAIALPNMPTEVLLVTYQGVPLGFVKNVGNHCNNLYPKEWRIRKL